MNVDLTSKHQRIISLCTGMRGLERGIERAGVTLRTLAYVEIEAFICENLVQQMEQGVLDEAPIWSNIKTFNGKPFRGLVDGITGGYPCQPFSVAGQRKGTEDQRHLWPYIKTLVGAIKPVWCFFENVPGHITLGYREVRQELEGLGYTVKEGIFSAEEVGATHRRERLFIMAISSSIIGRLSKSNQWDQEAKTKGRGKNVADRNSKRLQKSVCGEFGSIQQKKGKSKRSEFSGTNAEGNREMANTDFLRSQQRDNDGVGRDGQQVAFPARPGQIQHLWEPSRTIESRLGFMLNGYNFREDLLRMAGNGVVEQTAELAFRTLLQKFQSIDNDKQ